MISKIGQKNILFLASNLSRHNGHQYVECKGNFFAFRVKNFSGKSPRDSFDSQTLSCEMPLYSCITLLAQIGMLLHSFPVLGEKLSKLSLGMIYSKLQNSSSLAWLLRLVNLTSCIVEFLRLLPDVWKIVDI